MGFVHVTLEDDDEKLVRWVLERTPRMDAKNLSWRLQEKRRRDGFQKAIALSGPEASLLASRLEVIADDGQEPGCERVLRALRRAIQARDERTA